MNSDKKNHNESMRTNENIEKSLQKSHGYSQDEYEQDIDKLIEVEKKREKDHEKNKHLQSDVHSKL